MTLSSECSQAGLLGFAQPSAVVGHREHPLREPRRVGRGGSVDFRERHEDAPRVPAELVLLIVHRLGRVLDEIEHEKLKFERVAEHHGGRLGHLHENGHGRMLAEPEGPHAAIDGAPQICRRVIGRAVLHIAPHAVDDARNLERLGVDPLDGRLRIGIPAMASLRRIFTTAAKLRMAPTAT